MILWLLQCHVGIGSRRSRSKRRWRWDMPKRISSVIVGQSSRIFWMHPSISRLRWSNDSRISWPRVWHIQRWPGPQIACTLAAIHPSQSCSSSKNSMSIWGNNDLFPPQNCGTHNWSHSPFSTFDVDQHQKYSDQQSHPTWHHIDWNEESDEGGDSENSCW